MVQRSLWHARVVKPYSDSLRQPVAKPIAITTVLPELLRDHCSHYRVGGFCYMVAERAVAEQSTSDLLRLEGSLKGKRRDERQPLRPRYQHCLHSEQDLPEEGMHRRHQPTGRIGMFGAFPSVREEQ